jgi:putative membrane protein
MGWAVLTLPILYAVPLILAAWAWRSLLPARPAPSMGPLVKAIWIGKSMNDLVPTGGLSGDIVRARLVMRSGLSGHGVVASLVLDKTVETAAVVVQGAAAIAVLLLLGAPQEIVLATVAGWALLTLGIVGFVLVQRGGLFARFANGATFVLSGRRGTALVSRARGLDAAVWTLYRQPRRLASAFGLRLVFRLAFVIELWVIAILAHHPLSVLDAFMIEGLSAVFRGAAFIVPGALGIQEGSYILLGAIVGLDPALMLALALAKRAREILVGVPGLLAWQGMEGGIALARLRDRSSTRTK